MSGLHGNILNRENCALIVVDLQEKFQKSIPAFDQTVDSAVKLIRGFSIIGRPVAVTEQYPKGLGQTVDRITSCFDAFKPLEKTAFSCAGLDGIRDMISRERVDSVVVCGIETHVCINQTVLGFLKQGISVHLVEDAVASRKESDHRTALRKMEISGALPTSVETVIFELARSAGFDKFKDLQKIIK